MLSLFLRNLFFTILQPGVLAGLVPCLIIKDDLSEVIKGELTLVKYIGILLVVLGIVCVCLCIYYFIKLGHGTLSPADKTQKLVILGLYKYSRNPMYIDVLLILLGEVVFTNSIELICYGILVYLGFHFFVIFREEKRLKKDFGKQYEIYMLTVRRWI